MTLTAKLDELADTSQWNFSDLRALFINCTLKKSPEPSNTQGLADLAIAIMEKNGVSVDVVRAVDHEIATGVYSDMTEHGWDRDDWPQIHEQVMVADILVLLRADLAWREVVGLYQGDRAPLRQLASAQRCRPVRGPRPGGWVPHHRERRRREALRDEHLYSLQHLGYVIPPQADAGWIGEAGPGPSYLDPGSGGPENDFTNRNTTFMTWNLLHLARMVKDAGGMPRTVTNARSGTLAVASTLPTPTIADRERGEERWATTKTTCYRTS